MECQSEENCKWDQVGEKPLESALLENRLIGVLCHRSSPSLPKKHSYMRPVNG